MSRDLSIGIPLLGITNFVLAVMGFVGILYGGWEVVAGKTQHIPLKFWAGLIMMAFVIVSSLLIVAVAKWDGSL